jgi:ADP-ribose pyrophosphatase
MALRPWKRISGGEVHRNPWWSYRRDEVTLPSGRPGEYYYVHTNGSSMTVAVLDDWRILLVKQHRYLASRDSLEFPCGSVKDGASYEQTALLELAEETGYSARTWLQLGEYNPYNGVTDELCRVYVALNLSRVGAEPDETEEFELFALTTEEIDECVEKGEIWDGMTLAAWALARPRLEGIRRSQSSESN